MKNILTLFICTVLIVAPPLYPNTYLAPPGAVDAGINIIRTPKKLIVFDVSNVCVSFDFSKAVKELKKFTERPDEKILEYLTIKSEFFLLQELGQIAIMEFYNEFMKQFRCKVNLDYTTFTEILTSIFQQNIQVMALMNYLLDKGYDVTILSNAGQLFKKFHIANHPVIRRIHQNNRYLTSSDINMLKSDRKAFEFLLHDQRVSAQEAVFIDDINQYVQVAEDVGIFGIHFKGDVEKLVSRLIDVGIHIERDELLSYTLTFIKSSISESGKDNLLEIENEIARLLKEGEIILGLQGIFSLALHGHYEKALMIMADLKIHILMLSAYMDKSTAYSEMITNQLSTLPDELGDVIHALCGQHPADAARIAKLCADTFEEPSVTILEQIARSLLQHEQTNAFIEMYATLQQFKDGQRGLPLPVLITKHSASALKNANAFYQNPHTSVILIAPEHKGSFSIAISH